MSTRLKAHIHRILLVLILLPLPLAQAQENNVFPRTISAAKDLLRSDPDSASVVARQAIDLARTDAERAEARELCGEALLAAGDPVAAQAEFHMLLDQAIESGNAHVRGRALNGLGVVARSLGYWGEAAALHAEAGGVFDSLGNVPGAAQSLHDLAITMSLAGRTIHAMDVHRRALAMREEEQFRAGIAESRHGIGSLYLAAGKTDAAILHYREALALRKQLGVLTPEVAATLAAIGNVYRSQGDMPRALDYYRESIGISRQLGDDMSTARTLGAMGASLRQARDVTRGREALEEALWLAVRLRQADLHADVLLEQSKLEQQAGNLSDALRILRRYTVVRDSIDRHISDSRLQWHEGHFAGVRPESTVQDHAMRQEREFLTFLVVVTALLFVIAVIALSALRLRGRSNRELFEKNAEIQHMIVELQRLNHDLVRSEEKYRLLFERLPVGVFLYNQDLTLIEVNIAFADIIGTAREKLEGLNFASLRDRRILPALQAAIAGKTGAYEGEYIVSTNEAQLQVSVRTAPLKYHDLPSPHGIGFVLEISNWKRVEHDLIESCEIAVQADRLKNAFLTNISHEIRTPLNIIMGYFGILHQDMRDRITEEEADYFDKVDFAVRRLLRTVDQILTLSILESGNYTANAEQCNLHELAEQLVEEMRPVAQEKGVDMCFESGCPDVYIISDKYSVGQALRNLLDNAIKFTDEGVIQVALQCSASHISFIVRDTGIGMSPDYVQQLFEAFSQEDTGYSRTYEGLGLGLRLTKRYLDVNNGSIHVESEKGEGTTFTVTFAVAHRYAHSAPPVETPQWDDTDPGLRRTLLVVEDDHETQKFLQLILSSSFDLHFADSAEDAWETLHDTTVDLVLMDISLRGDEDGLQLTGRIREDAQLRDLPVIAVTAHAFADDRRRSLEAGCNEYLPKPFRVNQLRELVERFLQ